MLKRARFFSNRFEFLRSPRITAKMSTFALPDFPDVAVKLVDGLSQERLLGFPAFKNWLQTLRQSLDLQHTTSSHPFHTAPYKLRSITVQAVDQWGPKIGFIKMQAEVTNDEGEHLPTGIFLRGASVGMMVVFQPDDLPKGSQEEKHVLLTVQSRIPAGSLQFVELPAGMVDDFGTFGGAAASEIKKELDMEIPESELINLTELAIPQSTNQSRKGEVIPRAMFPSAGGCDEYIPLFLHEKRVPREQLKEWTGKLTGLRDEGERITLKLVKMEDLWLEGARDSKALGAWALYDGLRKQGKLCMIPDAE